VTAGEAFEDLVSNLDYPMFIVTTAADGEASGCLVGFVGQASIDPPRLLVMISKANHTYDVALRAEVLVVHFLTTDNHDLATLFGEKTGDTTDKFTQCKWQSGPDGVPILDGVGGWVAGRVLERFDAGDHVGHLLETIDAKANQLSPALTFSDVRDMEPGHDP
jgi:flavin reductase (DIM6/NTAB) family NADH-FMN oxidoreductase RutF